MPELLFNKVAGLRPATLFKKTLAQVFSCEFCEVFLQNTLRQLLLHLLQNTTLIYYISFIEGTYQRFILVLYFNTPKNFLVALFILVFLDISSGIYF